MFLTVPHLYPITDNGPILQMTYKHQKRDMIIIVERTKWGFLWESVYMELWHDCPKGSGYLQLFKKKHSWRFRAKLFQIRKFKRKSLFTKLRNIFNFLPLCTTCSWQPKFNTSQPVLLPGILLKLHRKPQTHNAIMNILTQWALLVLIFLSEFLILIKTKKLF